MHTASPSSEHRGSELGLSVRTISRDSVESLALERSLATAALFLIGLRSQWHLGLTTGYLAALALLPLTLPSLATFRWAKLLIPALGACMTYGLVVVSWTRYDHVISTEAQRQTLSLVVGITASAILVLWARRLMPTGAIAVAFGFGQLVAAGGGSEFAHAWKYQYSVPVTLIVLGFAALRRSPLAGGTALCVLAGVTIFADARSLFTTYVVTVGLLVCSHFLVRRGPRNVSASRIALVIGILFAVYKLADVLIMSGFLGEKARERSMRDVAASGSTLLGGRPELASTVALMRDHVAGYGAGAIPNTHDVAVGNEALENLGLQPTQNGFSTYMFGRQQYELHSVFGDLWANFGIVGLAVSGMFALLVLIVLSSAISGHRVSALLLFLACASGWNVVSSPLWDSAQLAILFIGLSLPCAPSAAGRRDHRSASVRLKTQLEMGMASRRPS